MAGQFEKILKRTVLPCASVNERPHDIGSHGVKALQEVRVDVEDLDVHARFAQRGCDAPSRVQGHLAFVRQAPGENRNREWSGHGQPPESTDWITRTNGRHYTGGEESGCGLLTFD